MKVMKSNKPYTVADDNAPAIEFIRCYRHFWSRDPLCLIGLTSIDPRRDPRGALMEAVMLLAADNRRRQLVILAPERKAMAA